MQKIKRINKNKKMKSIRGKKGIKNWEERNSRIVIVNKIIIVIVIVQIIIILEIVRNNKRFFWIFFYFTLLLYLRGHGFLEIY